MPTMMEQLEVDRKRAEWEDRFVMFGFILIEALKRIAEDINPDDSYHIKIAREALDKFNEKVSQGKEKQAMMQKIRFQKE